MLALFITKLKTKEIINERTNERNKERNKQSNNQTKKIEIAVPHGISVILNGQTKVREVQVIITTKFRNKGKGQNVENHFVESQKKNIESLKI
jgi:hypothetical protein